jgi:hypothetical protein
VQLQKTYNHQMPPCHCHICFPGQYSSDFNVLPLKMTALISSIQRYHCHPATATPRATATPTYASTQNNKKIQKIRKKIQDPAQKPPQLGQYCHSHTLSGTKMTALISSIQRYHCHPATATPCATATHRSRPPPQLASLLQQNLVCKAQGGKLLAIRVY